MTQRDPGEEHMDLSLKERDRSLPTNLRHVPIQFSASESSLPPVDRLCSNDRRDGECAVDPDLVREFGGLRRAFHEAVGSGDVGRGQHLPSVLDHLGGTAEVDLLRGELYRFRWSGRPLPAASRCAKMVLKRLVDQI